MKDVLGNHLKDRLFHLVHWLRITLSLRRTSQESIILERKSYLDCSSDTLCTRGGFGRVTYWLQTLRSWRQWTHRKSTQKRLNAKEVIFPKENGKFIFPVADGRIQTLGGDQDLRTSTLIRERPIRGECEYHTSNAAGIRCKTCEKWLQVKLDELLQHDNNENWVRSKKPEKWNYLQVDNTARYGRQ